MGMRCCDEYGSAIGFASIMAGSPRAVGDSGVFLLCVVFIVSGFRLRISVSISGFWGVGVWGTGQGGLPGEYN